MHDRFQAGEGGLIFYLNTRDYEKKICFMTTGESNLKGTAGIFTSPYGADVVMSVDTFKRLLKLMLRFDEQLPKDFNANGAD